MPVAAALRTRIISPPTCESGIGHEPALVGVGAEHGADAADVRGEVPERQLDRPRRARRPGGVDDERDLVLVGVAMLNGAPPSSASGCATSTSAARSSSLRSRAASRRSTGIAGGAQQQAGVERRPRSRAPRGSVERDAVAGPRAAQHEPAGGARRDQQQLAVGQPLRRASPARPPSGRRAGGPREPGIDLHAPEANVNPMPVEWTSAGEYSDIRYEVAEGIAKITIDRPEVRNAFRPETLIELSDALEQRARGHRGRRDRAHRRGAATRSAPAATSACAATPATSTGGATVGRFHVTDLHVQIRRLPKPVVAMVAGYAIGGGHVLHLVCDLTIAADNARFGQTGPRVGSFDGGFGAGLLASLVGPKKAKEIWFLCRQYDAQQALDMGLVNTVVPLDRLEEETVQWCREMLALSPFALRLVKASFNAAEDGFAGIQQLAHDANLLFYAQRGGAGGARGLQGEAHPRLLGVPAPAVSGPLTAERPSAVRIWAMAARPRTLPAAVAPVLVGTALAATEDDLQGR